MNAMACRRKVQDRRANDLKRDQTFPYNHRTRPCRRLNNISAEWIPTETITTHPVFWQMFRKSGCV